MYSEELFKEALHNTEVGITVNGRTLNNMEELKNYKHITKLNKSFHLTSFYVNHRKQVADFWSRHTINLQQSVGPYRVGIIYTLLGITNFS